MAYLGPLILAAINLLFTVTARVWEAVTYALEVAFPASPPDHVPRDAHLSERQIFGPMAARVTAMTERRLQRDPFGLASGTGMRIAA